MKHIERINKLMNLAVKLEWIEKNPFVQYKVKFNKFDRPFLSFIELKKFESIELERATLKKAKDLFVFACYPLAIPFRLAGQIQKSIIKRA